MSNPLYTAVLHYKKKNRSFKTIDITLTLRPFLQSTIVNKKSYKYNNLDNFHRISNKAYVFWNKIQGTSFSHMRLASPAIGLFGSHASIASPLEAATNTWIQDST